MKSISIQFHATSEELLNFVISVSSELKLVVTMMTLKPFNLTIVEGKLELSEFLDKLKVGDLRLVLSTATPCIEFTSPNNFLDANSGSILIDIGPLSDLGLEESALSFISSEKDKISIANNVSSKLKRITKAGAIAVNPINGAEAKIRTHRYTQGAKVMADNGVKILPIAGNSFYKL
ncbi:hypothetical protein GCM10007978_49310 [Shewanella hanedai]|uniref:Uncharacterized protein n=1 Tax=Shewanella hanedai TaxID=25 RepID=A0A553JCZ5_SHEHA|nr:hypothetical protein [Shewanella hanedai]TRY10318.1 hypothetical protein FN961_25390 [Shewanella hanedai]GGJ05859.1 hypothetical protein GCM10007978_49310 [Shewanella hanedai]